MIVGDLEFFLCVEEIYIYISRLMRDKWMIKDEEKQKIG